MDSKFNIEYNIKLKALQQDLPFLLNVLERLRNNNINDTARQVQLEKMQKLYDLINDKTQILKWETLLKCETVVKKLQKKMEQQTELAFGKSERQVLSKPPLPHEKVPNTPPKPPLPTEISEQTHVINIDEIPVPESPPPQTESEVEILPIVIPTERCCSPAPQTRSDKKRDIHLEEQRKRTHHSHHHHHNQHHHHHHQNRQNSSTSNSLKEQHKSRSSPTTSSTLQDQHYQHKPPDYHKRQISPTLNTHKAATANNKNKNAEAFNHKKMYSPETAWDDFENESKNKLQSQQKTNNIFSRLGDKVAGNDEAECYETLKIKIQNNHHGKSSSKNSSSKNSSTILSQSTKDIAVTPISADILKSPPLTAKDISQLLLENNNSNSNSNSTPFSFDINNQKSTTNNSNSTTTNELSTFDIIRKKFALLTKAQSSSSEINSPSKSARSDSPTAASATSNERLALKYKPHPRTQTSSSPSNTESTTNLSNVNVLPTLRPNDPRLRRSSSILDSSITFPPQPLLPNPIPQGNHIPTIVSRQIITPIPARQPQIHSIEVIQSSQPVSSKIPSLLSIQLPYHPTLTPIPRHVSPKTQTNPVIPPLLNTNQSKSLISDPRLKPAATPLRTYASIYNYDDSSNENWDDDNACDLDASTKQTTIPPLLGNEQNKTKNDIINLNAESFKQNSVQILNSLLQRRNSTTNPLMQERTSMSYNEQNLDLENSKNSTQNVDGNIKYSRLSMERLLNQYENPPLPQQNSKQITQIDCNFKQNSADNSTRNLDHRSSEQFTSIRSAKLPPPRRKSMSWESHTNQRQQHNNIVNNLKGSPNLTSSSIIPPQRQSPLSVGYKEKFNEKFNDIVERRNINNIKKTEKPRTYGAYKEAKARAEAKTETEVHKNSEISKETNNKNEHESINNITTKPAPIANTTLDNLYRSGNMTISTLPKTNIGSFKIPKKTTATTTSSPQFEEAAKEVEKSGKTEKITDSIKTDKEIEIKTKSNNKKKDEAANNKITETKKETHKKTNITDIPKKDTIAEKAKMKKDIIKPVEKESATEKITKTEPKPQRDCFKGKRKQQTKALNTFSQTKTDNKNLNTEHISTRDPRIAKQTSKKTLIKPQNKSSIDFQEKNDVNITKKINVSDAVKSNSHTQDNNNDDEHQSINSENFNHTEWQIVDEIIISDTEEETKELEKKTDIKEKKIEIVKSPEKIVEDIIPLKPRRILQRRCTMIDKASAPEVDKEKLFNANAMLFEDLQERERKKKSATTAMKIYSFRREVLYDKTEDNSQLSMQNIISGKRRTRTTVNFNETQQAISVFKHLKPKAITTATSTPTTPITEKAVDAKTNNTPKVRQKPGSKPKPKPDTTKEIETPKIVKKTDETKANTQNTAPKQIRKRRQTLMDQSEPKPMATTTNKAQEEDLSEKPAKKSKQSSTDDQEISTEKISLPNVSNIFDSFIQKILDPETDAADLINKLRDILSKNEVQTLLDVREEMIRKQKTNLNQSVDIPKPQISQANKREKKDTTTTIKNVIEKNKEKVEEPDLTMLDISEIPENLEKPKSKASTSTNQSSNAKNKHKSELDRLHEDIRDMFISSGVLTATGRRMCTFVKPTDKITKSDDNETINTNSQTKTKPLTAARKTRSSVGVTKAKTPQNATRTTQCSVQETSNSESTELSTTTDISFSSETTSMFTISSSILNTDMTTTSTETTETTTQSDTSMESSIASTSRSMPKLKPATPIRLPEEDELEKLLAKTKNTETTKNKETEKTATGKTTTTVKKRIKPCPKSKKSVLLDESSDTELPQKIKEEILDITVPYSEPSFELEKYKQQEPKNINPKWHYLSRYAHVCVLCKQRVTFLSMHYKKCHAEHYASRLAPTILHQLKEHNEMSSKPILKINMTKTKSPNWHWLHRCPFCLLYKRTIYIGWLEHFIAHTGEYIYECTLCHSSYNKLSLMEKHMKERCMSMGGRYLHNDEISKSTKTATITAHICHLCNFLRLGRGSLEQHYIEQHNCDAKNVKNLGYAIVLMNFENVPIVETMEEALEVEEKLSSQYGAQFYDLTDDDDNYVGDIQKNKQKPKDTKKRKTTKDTLKEQHEKIAEPVESEQTESEENISLSTLKKLKSQASVENVPKTKSLKIVLKSSRNNKSFTTVSKDLEITPITNNENPTTNDNQNKPSDSIVLQTTETSCKPTVPAKTVIPNEQPTLAESLTTPKKQISNAFLSTTDVSNDEEETSTSTTLFARKLFSTVDDGNTTNSINPTKSPGSISMAERLSQRLKETSPVKQHLQTQINQETISTATQKTETLATTNETTIKTPTTLVTTKAVTTLVTTNPTATPSKAATSATSNTVLSTQKTVTTNSASETLAETTVEIMEDDDEENDGWEDIEIEIVESLPSANSSIGSNISMASSQSSKDSKIYKNKVNTLQKFSRLMQPMAGKSRKKPTKSLKSLMTLLTDNSSSENDATKVNKNSVTQSDSMTSTDVPKVITLGSNLTITTTKVSTTLESDITKTSKTITTLPRDLTITPISFPMNLTIATTTTTASSQLAPSLVPSEVTTSLTPKVTVSSLKPKIATSSKNIKKSATTSASTPSNLTVPTTSVATSSMITTTETTTSNSTLSSFGFRPLVTNISDLLTDSLSNDPVELAPELTPSSPLPDLNDVNTYFGDNLGIMDMDVEAPNHSICIHNINNQETSIQDALDFVTSQTENFVETLPDSNQAMISTPISMNRIQNVGFNCANLNNESSSNETNSTSSAYKFYCLSDRCTFLFSSEAIGLQNHFIIEHPHIKWNGYCNTCAKQIKFVSSNTEFSYTDEIDHLLKVHINKDLSATSRLASIASIDEDSNREQPRIKLRRLSGDCLSTTTINSNSSSSPALSNILDDSNSFSDLIRFNPRTITPHNEKTLTTQQTSQSPIEVTCIHNEDDALFKNISNDFQITSISSGLEPNEISEIVKNSYAASPTNTQVSSLQISNVVSLNKEAQGNLNTTSLSETTLQNTLNHNKNLNQTCGTLPLAENTISESITNVAPFPKIANVFSATEITPESSTTKDNNSSIQLPKITNVCSLSTKQSQRTIGSIWAQQITQERNELEQSTAESMEVSNILSNAWRKPPSVGRRSTQASLAGHDSPGPMVISETLPVAQATSGNFVITQTVSAQYNEENINSSNNSKPQLGFNISISAADLSSSTSVLPTSKKSNQTLTSIDLTKEDVEQTPTKMPPLNCLERSCHFNTRHFVAMIDHIKMHDRKNDSTQHEYLRCSVCQNKCSNVDDYTQHVRMLHFPAAPTSILTTLLTTTSTAVSSPISTTSLATGSTPNTSTEKAATALTEKIRNILSGNTDGVGNIVNSNVNMPRSSNSKEEVAFKEQLQETIKNMVMKTGIPDNKLYRCVVKDCNVKLNDETYSNHVLYHLSTVGLSTLGNFCCPHCKKKFNVMPLLKAHFKDHMRHKFFCYICLETGANSDSIAEHFLLQHFHKKDLKTYELLTTKSTLDTQSEIYYVVHSSPLSTENVQSFGKKLIIEWQRKKAATRTHFKPSEIDLVPIQAIFSRDIYCAVCQYKSKVRTNMLRHLQQHKADDNDNNLTNIFGGNQKDGTANTEKRTFMDPVNPVPCLMSNEKHFDRMTNLASSSLGIAIAQNSNQNIAASTSVNANAATCRLRYEFVPETKRYICGVPSCQYLTISEDIFRAHLIALHSDVRNYRCALCKEDICKKSFASERVIQHLRYHERTMFQCEQCDYNHYKRPFVEKHALEKHGNVGRANILIFLRNEENPLEGDKTTITVNGKKSKESSTNEISAVDNTNSSQIDNVSASTSSFVNSLPKVPPKCPKFICNLCAHKTITYNQAVSHCHSEHNLKHPYRCAHCLTFSGAYESVIKTHINQAHPNKAISINSIFRKMNAAELTKELQEFQAQEDKAQSNEMTRPLWQRDDPTRIRQIRGIPMEDEEETEKLRKRLRLSEDYYDDDDDEEAGGETGRHPVDIASNLYLKQFEFGCFHCEYKTNDLQELKKIHWHKAHSTASGSSITKPFHFRLLKRLKCAECRSFFGCYWELRKHLQLSHKKFTFFAADARNKQLVCAYCDWTCANATQLQRHTTREDHQPVDLKALTAVQMVQTMRLMDDEPTPFVHCLLCWELFCSGHEVAKHAHEKHSDEIERFSFRELNNTTVYRCSECGFASSTEVVTLRHMINHYRRFQRCHFCLEPQTTFNGYMQHCYSDHRTEIRRFSDIYPLNEIRKFLLNILVLFPNGLIVDKKNLRDTPYGSEERIKQFYAEICKTSLEPPIPRLSIGRLVASKSIEAKQTQLLDSTGSASTAAAMQLAGNANHSQNQKFTAKKITKRRSTVAIGNDEVGFLNNQQTFGAKKQKLSTHMLENRNNKITNLPLPPKFVNTTPNIPVLPTVPRFTHTNIELKPYSFYGKRPEPEDAKKIFTKIAVAGVNTRISLEKFQILVQLDVHVVLEKLNINKLRATRNGKSQQNTDEGEVGSSSSIIMLPNHYAHVKKACPASQKYRFT